MQNIGALQESLTVGSNQQTLMACNALCTAVTRFPPIGDAACRQHAGGRPSHRHRQRAQKFGKDCACGSADILVDRQTDTQTDILITILRNTILFLSLPQSEGWPHHGRTFSIYLYPLSFWMTLPQRVLSTSWCCLSRPCVVFLACVHLALFLALFLSPGNSLVMVALCNRADHYIFIL